MSIILPDYESIELVHDVVLEFSGGKTGIHSKKLILSAIERPATYIQYIDAYDIDTICALLIDSIARYHGFKDGNKRTALLSAVFTYRLNGVYFKASARMNRDFDALVMWVVQEKPAIEEIALRLSTLRSKHEGTNESWRKVLDAFMAIKKNHSD
jgi:death-on-curing protein